MEHAAGHTGRCCDRRCAQAVDGQRLRGRGTARAATRRARTTGEAACEPAQPGVDRHALLAIGSGLGNGVADDAAFELLLKQQLAAGRVDCAEPAVERTVEHNVAGCREYAAVQRQCFRNAPGLAARGSISRHKLSHEATGRGHEVHVGTDEPLRAMYIARSGSMLLQKLIAGT